MTDNRQYAALEWVLKEINIALTQAGEALERYFQDNKDTEQLNSCLTCIRQVYGSLQILELHSAAILTQEMASLLRTLEERKTVDHEKAQEVLMRAILQLPNYLQHMQETRRDNSSVALSLINELRAVRGANLLHNANFFNPDLSYAYKIVGKKLSIAEDDENFKSVTSKLRQMYRQATIGIVTGSKVDENLGYLGKVCEHLQKITHGTYQFSVWEITAALIQGLEQNTIGITSAVKNLFDQLDRELGHLGQHGIEFLSEHADKNILKNLLYCIANAKGETPLINAVKEHYALSFNDQDISALTDNDALKSLAAAIKLEFNDIKDILDRCLSDEEPEKSLQDITNILIRINDTLMVLGVGSLQKKIQVQISALHTLQQHNVPASNDQLLDIAQGIVEIGEDIDNALGNNKAQNTDSPSTNYHFDKAQLSVFQESRNSLETVKDAITEYIAKQWDIESIQLTPALLRETRGGLLMLPLERPAQILNACSNYIEQKLIDEEISPERQELDDLADAITSVDYYLERMIADFNDDSEFLLDIGEKRLVSLGYPVEILPKQEEQAEQSVETELSSEIEHDLEPEQLANTEQASIPNSDEEQDDDDVLDDEIIEIFIEEAGEVKKNITDFLPSWATDFNNVEALTEVRRAFHTLKGSGRMVNAYDIGELAWSIENMLNRVIDHTIPATAVIVDLIQKVCDILEDMIEAFKTHQPTPQQSLIEQYMAWGHQIANGDTVDISSSNVDLPENTATSDDKHQLSIDPQLLDIFINESNGHLKTVKHCIAEIEASMPIFHPPSDLMQRALHTLKGSAYMIEILPIADLMTAMENFVKELRGYQVDINADILQLIKDCVAHTEAVLHQLAENTSPEIPELPQFIVRVAEVRELTVGPIIHQQEHNKADPRLLENFMTTEMNLLLEIDSLIENWRGKEVQSSEWKDIIEELNKLSLGAEQAGLPSMNRLSNELTRCYEYLISGSIESSDQCYCLLQEGHMLLLNMMDAIAAGQNLPEIEEDFFARLQSLHIENESKQSKSSTATDENETELSRQTEKGDPKLVEQDSLQPNDPSTSSAADSETIDIEAVEQQSNPEISQQIDDEVIEIFLDESNELLEEIDETIHAWESDTSDTKNNSSLQRLLHTLKGGARMAGLTSLGDLAHDFESFLIKNKQNILTDDISAKIHTFQDKLHSAINSVTSGRADDQQPATDTAAELKESNVAQDDPVVDNTADVISVTEFEMTQSTDAGVAPFQSENAPSTPSNSLLESKDTTSTAAPAHIKAVPIATNIAKPKKVSASQKTLKVRADLMEELVNLAGETSISRGRMEEQISEITLSLDDMDTTVQRLQEQIRRLDIETEAQVLFRQEQMAVESGEFDPLEMDRYTQLQQLTRSLIESASDLLDFKSTLLNKIRDTETILLQQSRINTDLQEGLMRSRMVPFSSKLPKLRHIIRQVSSELNKSVNFEFDNVEGELDRSILEKMVAPLEHMLRNAVDHGIEDAATRIELGKPEKGRITLTLSREGGDIVLRLVDDGRGINVEKVRQKAIERKLMNASAQLSDQDILQFILHAGFSTAETVTQISGRGVGMDVVNNEIKQIGGSLSIDSTLNKGTTFTVRLPFTVSVNRALLVVIGDDLFAVPLNTIEGIALIKTKELRNYYSNADAKFEYANNAYQVRYLATIMSMQARPKLEDENLPVPMLLVHNGDQHVALQVDQLQSSREIVVKSLGPQFNLVQGLSGVTIMGDGNVVVILDLHELIRRDLISDQHSSILPAVDNEKSPKDNNLLVMVVDDSVTVRKVTTRLLEREGFEVITAKDGVEAMNMLQDYHPDVMLLDIEMPRMDGFEVTRNIRSSSRLKHLPIIMITSRTGEKHRQRGLDLGVNVYMGKPFQEEQLLKNIANLTEEADRVVH